MIELQLLRDAFEDLNQNQLKNEIDFFSFDSQSNDKIDIILILFIF